MRELRPWNRGTSTVPFAREKESGHPKSDYYWILPPFLPPFTNIPESATVDGPRFSTVPANPQNSPPHDLTKERHAMPDNTLAIARCAIGYVPASVAPMCPFPCVREWTP